MSRDGPQPKPSAASEADRQRARRVAQNAPPPLDRNPPFPTTPPLADSLASLAHLWLLIRRTCGRGSAIPLRYLAAERGWETPLGDVVPKLRCQTCGAAPATVDLTDDPTIDAPGAMKSGRGNRLRLR